MPRRKQDCPKRMKWDESHGDCPKQKDGRSDDGLGVRRSSGQKASLSKDDESSSRKDDDDEDGDSAFESNETSKNNLKNVVESDEGVECCRAGVGGVGASVVDGDQHDNGLRLENIIEDDFTEQRDAECRETSASPVSPLPTTCLSPITDDAPPSSVYHHHHPLHSPNYEDRKLSEVVKTRLDYDKQIDDEEQRSIVGTDTSGEPVQAHDEQDGPLDFSVKRRLDSSPSISSNVITSKESEAGMLRINDSPLDLSVRRKRGSSSSSRRELRSSLHEQRHHHHHHRVKSSRLDNKPSSPWSAQFPFCFSPTASPNSSVEIPLWNGSVKTGGRISPATSASSETFQHHNTSSYLHSDVFASSRSHKNSCGNTATSSASSMSLAAKVSNASSSNGRHNAWQSQWLSRGAEQARDVLKCVWCRKSFASLEEMTTHMKETKHCGVQQLHHSHQTSSLAAATTQGSSSNRVGGGNCNSGTGSSKGTDDSGNVAAAASAIKESMPMPRKLVRGQDVWLGKGAEQTKQILKCMWCGQSFKSLADMTTHMQQTQHYTNIISQEQIISWKSPEEKGGCLHSHVNAVLTCKVCDQAFSSLKELSNHMVKNSHYKEHILRSITENGGRRRQTREKRKKSLPVRKLLELERAQNEVRGKSGGLSTSPLGTGNTTTGVLIPVSSNGRITCEKCGHKIDTQSFVDHIRLCVGGSSGGGGRATKSASSTSSSSPEAPIMENVSPVGLVVPSTKNKFSDDGGGATRLTVSPSSKKVIAVTTPPTSSPHRLLSTSSNGRLEPEAPSVLNAIERLIEKSFESKRSSRQVYVGSSSTTSPSPSSSSRCLTSPPNRKSSRSMDRDTPLLFTSSHEHSKGRSTPSTKGNHHVSHKECSFTTTSTAGGGCGEMRLKRLSKQHHNDAADSSDYEETTKTTTERVSIKDGVVDDLGYREVDRPVSTATKRESCSPSTRVSSDAKTPRESPLGTHIIMMPPPSASSVSPPRIVESPGSCSDGSVGDRGSCGSGSAGRLMSFVRSNSSPVSPSCSDHPLKELQKLLDKTSVAVVTKGGVSAPSAVVVTSSALGTNGGGSAVGTSSPSTLGSLLSFSYACGGGGVGGDVSSILTGDSIIKCVFCDTPFISKTAYRHHLSKMHSKSDLSSSEDAVLNITTTTSSSFELLSPSSLFATAATSSTSITTAAAASSNSDDGCVTTQSLCGVKPTAGTTNTKSSSSSSNFKSDISSSADESPHSKFLKYTELAKQLSSKYV